MNIPSDHSVATVAAKRARKRTGNGEVRDALHDPDVAQLVAAEIDARIERLHSRIAEAAYFRAQQRDFAPGHELEDWLAAEAELTEHPPAS